MISVQSTQDPYQDPENLIMGDYGCPGRIASIENVTEKVFVASQMMLPCQLPQASQIGVDLPPKFGWVEL